MTRRLLIVSLVLATLAVAALRAQNAQQHPSSQPSFAPLAA